MKKSLLLLFISLLLISGCKTKQAVDYVDPFIGTGFHGHTYPGATTPYGSVQLSPDNRLNDWDACSGYHYSDSAIYGFSHTHLSGTGCGDLGDLLFHPTTDSPVLRPRGYIFNPIPYSHDNEKASAGYYSVKLGNGVLAELTATKHVGIHRYTYPKGANSKLIIDLAHNICEDQINITEISCKGNEVSGMRSTSGWATDQQVYFVEQFSAPFTVLFVSDGVVVSSVEETRGTNVQAVLTFPDLNGSPVVAKVGISAVSIENARMNLDAEMDDFNFDRIKEETRSKWNEALSAYTVSGADEKVLKTFYTALYHTLVTPNIISDVNGDYRGGDNKIHHDKKINTYSTFSLWDTFRAWHPLITLTDTAMVNDIIGSFLNFYDQTGELPIWPLASSETDCMIGYHSVSVIYDAFNKNIRGYDVEKALEAMKISSDKNSKGSSSFLELGFIPADLKRESVSCLLENAYDDWCIAEMARSLGHEEDYNIYTERAQMYKNAFDGHSRFFRPRMSDTKWVSPFNSFEVGSAYTEATAWQYRFFVPHDVNSLVNLLGGEKNFIVALDSLFTVESDFSGEQSDITGMIGQYAHGNEPSHHMAYLYNYAGQPWKTQEITRRILTEMYQPTPEGISGNEDCGQMSAWYVLSSLGIYPVCPGSRQFILTTPLFGKASIRMASGKELTITANDPEKNIYIKEVYLNGTPLDKNYITYSQLMEGGELKFVLDSKPNTERGNTPETYPYSFSDTKEVSVPYITTDISCFTDKTFVVCGTATEGAKIYFTVDGTEPSESSRLYDSPFTIDNSAVIRLKAYKSGMEPSITALYKATKAEFQPALKINLSKNGINYKEFEGAFTKTSDILTKGKLIRSGTTDSISFAVVKKNDYVGVAFNGYINAPVDGIYTFSTTSDDGSLLRIGEQVVVNNDGLHSAKRSFGRVALRKGLHPIEVLYFEGAGDETLTVYWAVPGVTEEEPVAAEYLFIK